MKSILSFVFIISFCFNPLAAFAQQTQPVKKFELTVDSIMRANDLIGYEPDSVRWSRDNQKIYFRWKRAGEPRIQEYSTYAVNRDGSALRKLSDEEAKQAPPVSGDLSEDKKLTVFAENGDVFLYDHDKSTRRQITNTTEIETSPRFASDGRRVYFTRQNNLFALSLSEGLLEQLTDIRAAGAPNPDAQKKGTESQETIKKEERELLEVIRERAEKREQDEKKRKEREKRKPFQLAQGQTIANLMLSPDGTYAVAVVNEGAPSAKNTIVPNYVTESAYTEDIPARTKVGDVQGRSRMAIINVENGESKWVEHGRKVEIVPRVQTKTEGSATDQAAQQRGTGQNQQQAQQTQNQQNQQVQNQQAQNAARAQQTETAQQAKSQDREVQLFALQWSENGKNAVLQARSADNKDRWIMLLDAATGKTKVLASVHDEAWVGGPGAFTVGWLPDNRRVYFQSERDGFSHLYTVSIDGSTPVQLTSGQFEVSDVRLSEDKTKFYFTSSEGSFFERHLYSMPFEGGARTRLTTMAGNNQADVSPDETALALVRSYSNKPPELYIAPNKTGSTESEIKQVTTSPVDAWRSYNWIEPPIVSFKARDGATVYSRFYKPKNFKKGGPAVVFVHGAGYLQNVHNWWSTYFREYMFHHLLMEKGYAVLDVDYRGSAGYGRDWRTGIYRYMGDKDLTDHVDAAQYLIKEHGVNEKRIGIYGGSYGGFITLMAMFTTPDVFAAGAALRPVTDWAHYNHPYTSNILNLPQNDLEAYKRSSPIYHAAGLKGALLICHGMVDVNVHYQDSVRLAQKLIELRKENWELAAYPVEDHAFVQPTSWADEYKRILKLFETNLHPRGKK